MDEKSKKSFFEKTRSPTRRAEILRQANAPFRVASFEPPSPAAGQALVRIVASGVNPLDTKIRAGLAAHAKQPLPAVLGLDMAGGGGGGGKGVSKVPPWGGGGRRRGRVGGATGTVVASRA